MRRRPDAGRPARPHVSGMRAGRGRRERGAVLVEFALVALVLSLLFAAIVDMGRATWTAQVLEEVARVAARELALAPLPATMGFDEALDATQATIFDAHQLVIDLGVHPEGPDLDAYFAGLPIVNRMLRPLMIVDNIGDGSQHLLRYPGALLADSDPASPTGLTVAIPRVLARDASGVETIDWVGVLEEIRSDPSDPATGPFSLASSGPDRGLVALRVNYPWQAAALVGYLPAAGGPFEPNINGIITADDAAVTAPPPPGAGTSLLPGSGGAGTYAGTYGLGKMYAMAKEVRPFRRLLSVQALERREVFQ